MLLRAGEVVDGLEARARRAARRSSDRDLARGPARLCQALGIDGADDGADLAAGPTLRSSRRPRHRGGVRTGPRVGLRERRATGRGGSGWPGEPTVSPYRPREAASPDSGSPARRSPDAGRTRS